MHFLQKIKVIAEKHFEGYFHEVPVNGDDCEEDDDISIITDISGV